jgi:hypothetical protein
VESCYTLLTSSPAFHLVHLCYQLLSQLVHLWFTPFHLSTFGGPGGLGVRELESWDCWYRTAGNRWKRWRGWYRTVCCLPAFHLIHLTNQRFVLVERWISCYTLRVYKLYPPLGCTRFVQLSSLSTFYPSSPPVHLLTNQRLV